MIKYTYSDELISDLHKDAYGTRPNDTFMARWDSWSPDQKQECWEVLTATVEREIEEQYDLEVANEKRFYDMVAEIGLRAWVERLNLSKVDLQYGGEYICYRVGLPYAMESIFNPVCKELLAEIEQMDARADEAEYFARFG